jgi:uncharacterized protein DUF4199
MSRGVLTGHSPASSTPAQEAIMKKTVWTFGLISGAILSVMMVATMPFSEQIGFDRGAIIGYTTMVLAFLLVYFGVRSYRDNVRGGAISFGRALAVGALITLVSSACYVATWELLYFKFMPDFGARYAAHAVEAAKTSGSSQAAIDQKVKEMEKFNTMYQNPLYNSALTFLEPLPVGLVFVLLSAAVLRRKRRDDDVVIARTSRPTAPTAETHL